MFIKLGIIVGIVILGGMIFSNEIDSFFPTTSATVFDSLKNDMNIFGTKASDSVEQRIDSSIDKIINKTSESISNEISNVGDKVSDEISDVKESSQKLIKEEVSNFNPIKSIQNIFTGSSNLDSVSQSSNVSIQNTVSIIPGTLSLSTKQQSDDNILLQYIDTTGKTKSVNVVIRTADREIFSGTFYTSVFDTNVNDASGIPYYIDMIVEHEDYGTVTSSVYNSGDSSDTKINGIFSQS
jgi:YesN/AraC family two-component response regulator